MNSVVMIDAGGATTRTLPKDVQFHPVTDRPLHVDFLRISEHATVTVAVPINFVDEEKSKGLKRGGVLNTVRHELELVCDAAEIPEEIEISLAGLDIGNSLHIYGGHLAQGRRERDHRPRLHHRHDRRAVRPQDGRGGRRSRSRRAGPGPTCRLTSRAGAAASAAASSASILRADGATIVAMVKSRSVIAVSRPWAK